jgi:transcriptional regulator with XRE-family HTH domain
MCDMGTRERPIDRANRLSATLLAEAGREIRLARIGAGLSQCQVARAAGVSHPTISRIERGSAPSVSVQVRARVCAAVGLDLSLRLFAGDDPVRDAGHLRLLERLRIRVHPKLRGRSEVPLPLPGDRPAWDATIRGEAFTLGVEAETRIRDAQAVMRNTNLKQRDGGLDHVLLLVADTRGNRAAVQHAADQLHDYPITRRDALQALREGRDPGGNALIIL